MSRRPAVNYMEDDFSSDSYSDEEFPKRRKKVNKKKAQSAMDEIKKQNKDTKFEEDELIEIPLDRPSDFIPDSVSKVFGSSDFHT